MFGFCFFSGSQIYLSFNNSAVFTTDITQGNCITHRAQILTDYIILLLLYKVDSVIFIIDIIRKFK